MAQNIIIKKWIYEKIQNLCSNRTIVWHKNVETNFETGEETITYTIKVNGIVRETEKAVCYDCVYWYIGGRSINFTEYSGHKVWIPKSAIIDYDYKGLAVAM